MIITGFLMFVTTLSWSTNGVTYTVGQAFDVVVPVLFLHVFLAFPDGKLHGLFERVLVAVGYVTAIVLELVRMTLGGFGPHNLLELTVNAGVAEVVRDVQLLTVSAISLCGVGILFVRRRRSGRPLRRASALLVDAFGLGLIMIAVLLTSATLGGPWVAQIRWVTFITVGLAPLAFVLGLLRARLGQSAVGGLLVDLRDEPAPADLRDALARALRDPSLTLAYWLPEFGTFADLDGRAVRLPEPAHDRTVTLIERNGVRIAALVHDPSLQDEPALLEAVTAGAGIALENAQLHAEQRAHLEELRGSRARIVDAGRRERQRLERNLHDGAQQRLIALSLELSLLEEKLASDADATARLASARREIGASLEELREVARGLHPAVVSGHGLAVALEQLVANAAPRGTRGGRVLPRVGEPRQRREVRAGIVGDRRGDAKGNRRRRRDRRRRSRRSRRGAGLRVARSRGPRRSARRPAARVEPNRRRNANTGGDAVRAVIAEDSVLLREGVARVLGDAGIEVVGACETADDLLLKVRSLAPDIAIVDIRLPPTHSDEGMQAALAIRAAYPSVAVLVLSQYVEVGLAMKLLSESAEGTGYLLKDRISDVKEFVGAVERVASGGSAIDPIIVSTLLSKRRSDDPLDGLTPREREVLELMAEGRSNQGIADRLVITLRSVEKYVSSVFDKLGLPSSATESRRVLAVLLYLRS
jgi:DNA-binding NarL/FixJ family response regulator/signal transduction histidine kinase